MKRKLLLSGVTAGLVLASSVLAISTASVSVAGAPKFSGRESVLPVGYSQPSKSQKLRLAYLNPVGGNEALDAIGTAMQKATIKLGGTFISLDGKGSVDTQVSQLQQLIAQKVNGILVFALDPNAMKPALAQAKAAGIKLISIDENFVDNNIGSYDSQIMQRRGEAAFIGAQKMTELAGAGATVGTMDFAIAVPSIVYSIAQAKKWAIAFGLKVAGNASNPSDDIAGGTTAGTQLLSKNPTMKGVIAYNDPSAIGASTAAKALGKTGLIFGGQNGGSDAFAAVKAGTINYTIQIADPSVGKYAAWGLYNLVQKRVVRKSVRADAPILITSANVDTAKTWAQILAGM